MPVNLSKGGNVNLSKEAPGLNKISVGLGWDPRVTDGTAFDLDASVFLLTAQGVVRSDADFIFYNQASSTCGSVKHKGDNRTGQGDGDDEVISIELSKVPTDVEKLVFAVTIHEGTERGQNFGQVPKAHIRVVNDSNSSEVARYDLSEDASTVTAMIFGELYRAGAEWKFKAIGSGFNQGLGALAKNYGIHV